MRPVHLIALLSASVVAWYDCPFPTCEGCLPASVHDAPGIGFGLSFSSGTAAAHFYNGTVVNVARIAATPDFTALMARLANSVSASRQPNLWEICRRSINKKMGRPATPDVGILADMFIALRDAVASTLGHAATVHKVAVSHPPMKGLATYDIFDALEYAGLGSWMAPDETPQAGMYPDRLTEAHAMFGAHGLGLCSDYKNLFECWDEEEEAMPLHTVLLAGLTEVDLRAERVRLRAPFDWMQTGGGSFVDLEAGLNAMGAFESEEMYWKHVHDRLADMARTAPARLSMVLLVGENATHPTFLDTIRDALAASGYSTGHHGEATDDQLTVLVDANGVIDLAFASARGAAQYARWRQEAQFGCSETEECKKSREKERAHEKAASSATPGTGRIELR